jgi:hypothetical protein
MSSLSLLISSIAESQFTDRISQASLPQVAARSLSPSVVYHVSISFSILVAKRTSTRKR